MPIVRRSALLATAVTVIAAMPAVASAVSWTPGAEQAAAQSCDNRGYGCYTADVVTAPDGTTTAAWLVNSGSSGSIMVATRAPGAAAFGTPVTLGSVSSLSLWPGDGAYPSIAVAGDGTTHVAWRYDNQSIRVATRAPGASVGVGQQLNAFNASWPSIAASPNGTAIVAWNTSNGTNVATRGVGEQTFTRDANNPILPASTVAWQNRPFVAATNDATVVAAYTTDRTSLGILTRPAGGAWGTAQTLPGAQAGTTSIATGSDGTIAIVTQNDTPEVAAMVRPPGTSSTFSAVKQVSATGTVPDVAVDPSGNVHVTWFDYDGTNYVYSASMLAAGGASFGAPETLTTEAQGGQPPRPQITASADGSVTAAYIMSPDSGSSFQMQSRTRPSGGTYDPAVTLSNAGSTPGFSDTPALAGGPGNLTTAVWPSAGRTAISAAWTLPNLYGLTVSKAGTGSGTITSAPAGIDCGATCTASFEQASTVTLTAAPATGSTFAGWSGAGCSGTATCAVTMSAAQSVTATFALVPAPGPTPGPAPGPTPGPDQGVRIPTSLAQQGLPVSAGGTVGLPLACPSGIPGGCDASGVLSVTLPGAQGASGRKGEQASRTRVLARFRGVEIASGKRRLHTVRLAPATYVALRRQGVRRVPGTLRIVNQMDGGTRVVTRERVWLRILPLRVPVTG
jgi:hypothetical protein